MANDEERESGADAGALDDEQDRPDGDASVRQTDGRGDRLAFSRAVTQVGLFFLASAVLLSSGVVVDHLYAGSTPVVLTAGIAVALLVAWFVVPLLTHLTDRDQDDTAVDAFGPAGSRRPSS